MHVLFPNGNEAYWAELQATWVLPWSKKHYKQQEIIKSRLYQEEIWALMSPMFKEALDNT